MARWARQVAIGTCISAAIYLCLATSLLVLGTAKSPPVSAVITGPFAALEPSALPTLRRYRARDGAQLAYRRYSGGTAQNVLLIHGSAGSSIDMHVLATALSARGYSVYVPDLRGHGANRPHGDLAYVGQLDDDTEDFMQAVARPDPAARWTLIGFSSGGGFALRVAAEQRITKYFTRVVLLAPYLRYDAPSTRQQSSDNAGPAANDPSTPWAAPYVGRIIGLSMLDHLGIHAFDGLTVLVFAVQKDSSRVTRTYSWRMQQNFGVHDDYAADIRALPDSTLVLVGTEDSVLIPATLGREFQSRRAHIEVLCVPHTDHSGLVTRSQSVEATLDGSTGRMDPALLTPCE